MTTQLTPLKKLIHATTQAKGLTERDRAMIRHRLLKRLHDIKPADLLQAYRIQQLTHKAKAL